LSAIYRFGEGGAYVDLNFFGLCPLALTPRATC